MRLFGLGVYEEMAVVLLICAAAAAAQASSTPLEAKGAWVREPPPSAKVAALYVVIENNGDRPEELAAARTDAARSTEIHSVRFDADGVARMEAVPSVVVPAGGSFEFRPGGHHLMLRGLLRPLKAGGRVRVELEFASGTVLVLDVPVRRE